MKSIAKFNIIFILAIFLLSYPFAFAEDKSADNDRDRFEVYPVLILTLKVSSITASDADDSLKISQRLNRNLHLEQSLWAMIRSETRVYSDDMIETSFSPSRYRGRRYNVGTSFLLEQAREEAHRRVHPHYRDTFRDFFGYTDFLYRSNRSIMTADGRNIRTLEYSHPVP